MDEFFDSRSWIIGKNIILFGITSALILKLIVNMSAIKKYLKTKIKLMAMVSNHTCLAVITLDSAQKKDENYYLQVFLKECKYTGKMIRQILLII